MRAGGVPDLDASKITSGILGTARGGTGNASGAAAQADQAALEAETNEDTYAPPDLIKHSPGVAKVWCLYEQSGAHSITASHNMTSVTDGGAAGDSDILWGTDFSGDTVYAIVGGCENAGFLMYQNATLVAGGVTLLTRDHANTATDFADPGACFAVFGDQ